MSGSRENASIHAVKRGGTSSSMVRARRLSDIVTGANGLISKKKPFEAPSIIVFLLGDLCDGSLIEDDQPNGMAN